MAGKTLSNITPLTPVLTVNDIYDKAENPNGTLVDKEALKDSAGIVLEGYQKKLTAGTGIKISAENVISVEGPSYTLPAATASTLGGVKVGTNLSVTADGTVSVKTGVFAASSHSHSARDIVSGTLDSNRLPIATACAIGGVKPGAGLEVSECGTMSLDSTIDLCHLTTDLLCVRSSAEFRELCLICGLRATELTVTRARITQDVQLMSCFGTGNIASLSADAYGNLYLTGKDGGMFFGRPENQCAIDLSVDADGKGRINLADPVDDESLYDTSLVTKGFVERRLTESLGEISAALEAL